MDSGYLDTYILILMVCLSLFHTHTHSDCVPMSHCYLPFVWQVTFSLQWRLMITVSSGSVKMRIPTIWSSALTSERLERRVSTLQWLLCRCVKCTHWIVVIPPFLDRAENGLPQGNMGNTPVRYQISLRKWMLCLCFISHLSMLWPHTSMMKNYC